MIDAALMPVAAPMLSLGAAGLSGSNGALATFLLYTVVVFLLALLSHRLLLRRSFLSEYFLGSRKLGAIALALTFAATSASAGSFAGFPSLIYSHGWVLALWIASYMIVALTTMGLLGKRLNQVARQTGAITLPDVFRERFQSPALGLWATVLIFFLLSFYLVPQFKVGSLVLAELLKDVPAFKHMTATIAPLAVSLSTRDAPVRPDYLLCLLMFAAMVIFYTSFGGFRAVVWTDILQGLVMVVGVMIMLVLALVEVGGMSAATDKLAQMTPPRLDKVVFERAGPAPRQGNRIDADTWLIVRDDTTGSELLLRTNELALIEPGDTASRQVKAVQITTPAEITAIRADFPQGMPPPLPDGVTARVTEMKTYAFGRDTPGVYVTAPGPHLTETQGFLPAALALSFFFFWAISGTGQPGNMLRLMAFDGVATLKRGIAIVAVYFAMIYFPLVIIFTCARIIVPGLDYDSDRIMPKMAFSVAQIAHWPWLAGLLVAAPFAAAMSTVDSFMLMISSSLVRDVYQRNINPDASQRTVKMLSYICTLAVGLGVTWFAVSPPRFLQYVIIFASGGLAVSFLMPLALALFWPRMNKPGMFAGMLGGLAVFLGLYFWGWVIYEPDKPMRPLGIDPLVWGLAASLVCAVIGALTTPPPPRDLVRRFFYAK